MAVFKDVKAEEIYSYFKKHKFTELKIKTIHEQLRYSKGIKKKNVSMSIHICRVIALLKGCSANDRRPFQYQRPRIVYSIIWTWMTPVCRITNLSPGSS